MKRYVLPQAGTFALAVLFSSIAGGAAILVQFTKGNLLDRALEGLGYNTIRLTLLLLALIIFELVSYHLFDRLRGLYFVRAKAALREDFFRAQLRKAPQMMMEKKQGSILAAYTDQVDLVGNSYLLNLPLFFDVVLKIILVSLALFLLDVRVASLTILLLTTPLYIPKLIEGRLQKAQSDNTKAFQEHLGKIAEWLSGFELIKNYGAEVPILGLFLKSNHKLQEKDYAMRKMSYLSRSLSALLSYLSHFIILAYSAWLVVEGSFTAGSFFIAVGMIDQLSYPIISISLYIQEIVSSRPIVKDLLEEIAAPATEDSKESIPKKPLNVKFDGVSFAYANNRSILKNFNLDVHAGEKCLITGPSGSGKTTLMNLLLGYYPPDKGSVSIGEAAADEIKALNSYLTIMRQDPVLFDDTLRNNLSLYRDIPDETLMEMLRKVNLKHFANREALDRKILEGGSNLSGGERKRICLARTLVRKSPIIILDEPLANVDPKTADQIADLIARIEDTTLFVISHLHSRNWTQVLWHRISVPQDQA